LGKEDECEAPQFTIEQFYRFLSEKKLMAARCIKCGTKYLPPRPICSNCYSRSLDWIQLETRGKLITYTIIHVAPPRLQSLVPYAYGILELEDGLRLPGMIRGIPDNEIRIGMELEVTFESAASEDWPKWPMYYFKPPR